MAAGVSSYGDWLTVVALAVLLFHLTGQPEAPALYIFARLAPSVLGPTPGGSLADRFGPSRVAGWCGLLRAVLDWRDRSLRRDRTVWAILIAVAGAQFLGSMAQPGYGASIPRVTRPDRLLRVNAIYSGLFESSVLAAPAIGALLLSWIQPEALVAADAASFLVAGVLMLSLRLSPAAAGFFPARGRLTATPASSSRPRGALARAVFFCSAAAITALQAVLSLRPRSASDRTPPSAGSTPRSARVASRGACAAALEAQADRRRRDLDRVPARGHPARGLCARRLADSRARAAGVQHRGRGRSTRPAGRRRSSSGCRPSCSAASPGVLRLLLYSGMLAGAVAAVALVDVVGWSALVVGASAVASPSISSPPWDSA